MLTAARGPAGNTVLINFLFMSNLLFQVGFRVDVPGRHVQQDFHRLDDLGHKPALVFLAFGNGQPVDDPEAVVYRAVPPV